MTNERYEEMLKKTEEYLKDVVKTGFPTCDDMVIKSIMTAMQNAYNLGYVDGLDFCLRGDKK